LIAKEMGKIQAFDCKYADTVKKRTLKAPDYILKLRVTMATVTEREMRQTMYRGKRV
jgi:hypothetical protein